MDTMSVEYITVYAVITTFVNENCSKTETLKQHV